MRILITGAAGAVGTVLVNGLRHRYPLRVFDRVPLPDFEDAVVGELTDFRGCGHGHTMTWRRSSTWPAIR